MSTPLPIETNRRGVWWHAGPLCVIALAILAAYSSTWSATYGFMDDYNIVYNESQHDARILWTCVEQGRALDGVILHAVFSRIHHIGTISHARGLAQIFIVLAAFVFYTAMVRSGWPRSLAAGLAIVCGTVPAMLVYAAWGIEVAQPLAVALAGIAAILTTSSGESGIAMGRSWALRSAAGLGFLAALLIYQPAAMTYWAFVAINMLGPGNGHWDRPAQKNIWSRLVECVAPYAIVAAMALGLAWVAVRWGLHFQIPPVYQHDTSAAVRAKLIWPSDARSIHEFFWQFVKIILDKCRFFRDVLGMSLNLTNINTSSTISILVGLLIATGLPMYVGMTSRQWEKLLLAAVLLPATYIPNLIVQADWPAFRTQVGVETLVAFYVLVSMQGWWWVGWELLRSPKRSSDRPWLPASCMAMLAGASVLAAGYFVTVYFVLPQTTELRLAQSLLNDPRLAGTARVELIGADWSDSAAPAVYYEEFGQPSTFRPWGGIPMIRLLLAAKYPGNHDTVVFETPDLPHVPGSIIIDMRSLRTFRNSDGG